MNPTTETSFWRRLRQRHVIPVLTGWFGISWALIEFSSFLVGRYAAPEELIDAIFIGMWTLLPAVMLLTWWIGEAGSMHWTSSRAITISLLAGAGLLAVSLAPEIRGTQGRDVAPTHSTAQKSPAAEVKPVPRVLIMPFRRLDLTAEDRWLGDAFSVLTEYDLLFDPRFDVAAAATTQAESVLSSIRAQGGSDFDSANKAMLRNAAVAGAYNVLVTGSVARDNNTLSVRASLQRLSPDQDLGEFEIEANDIWTAVDRLAGLIREKIGRDDAVRLAKDPPLSSVTTESLPALRAYVEAARAGLQENDYLRAAELLDASIAADSNFAAADVLRLGMRSRLGEGTLANQIAQTLTPRMAMLPDRVRFSMQGYQAFAARDMSKVRSVYELWSRQAPYDREPRLMLATLDLRAAPNDEGAWQALHSLALESGGARELLGLGASALLRERWDAAIELATLARQRDPMEVGVPVLLADIAKLQGRHEDALAELNEAALMRPELITPVLAKATLLFDTGRWSDGLREVGTARARSENNPSARSQVLRKQISLLQSLGQLQEAFGALAELVEVERGRQSPAMLSRTLSEYVGLYAQISGVDAARDWIAKWNTFDDPLTRAMMMENLDLVAGLQMRDLSLYASAAAKMEARWLQSGQPMPASSTVYLRLAQAWQAGTRDSVKSLEAAARAAQDTMAFSGEPIRHIEGWRAQLVETALLHGHSDIAKPPLQALQRSSPGEPLVLWFTIQAALLEGDRNTAAEVTKQLLDAWKDADPNFPHLLDLHRVATELGIPLTAAEPSE